MAPTDPPKSGQRDTHGVLKHQSVARPLIIVYGLLLIVVLAAALFSNYALRQIQSPLNRATKSGLTIAGALNELGTNINEIDRLIGNRKGRSRANLASFQTELARLDAATLFESRRIQAAAGTTDVSALMVARDNLSLTLQSISRNEKQLSDAIAVADKTRERIANQVAQGVVLVRERSTSYSIDQSGILRKISELRHNLTTLGLNADAAMASRRKSVLSNADNLYATEIRRAVSIAAQLPNDQGKPEVIQTLAALFSDGRERGNLFDNVAQVIELEAAIQRQVDVLRDQIITVQTLSDQLLRQNNAATVDALLHASQTLKRQQTLIIAATLIGALAGLAVLYRYVYVAVVYRLRDLRQTTLRLSAGDLDAPIHIAGNDEITEFSLALEVFRDNARARAASEQALAIRTEQLEEVNKELDQFAYIASHDLRSPLHSIDSLASFLQEDLADTIPKESASHIELMRARIKRLQGLLDSLLKFSRVGSENHETENVDVDNLIRDNASLLEKPQFKLIFDLQIGHAEIMVTPFAQVVRNLVDNAIKHHDEESGEVKIIARRDETQIYLEVHDDGAGIKPGFHERIFEMFQTLKTRDDAAGSGMGLTFLRKSIHINDGTIRVESNPEEKRGTTFFVTWPLA